MKARRRGLYAAFLGIDGSGKSTLLRALADTPPAWCAGVSVRHLSPLGLRRHSENTDPHATPARGLAASLLKCAYWLVEHNIGYRLKVAPELDKGWLVLFDRHMVDALVDPRRYRYGGPNWALKLVWRLVPKPDLIIFLDAPVEVLAARKQEVELEAMVRLRAAYRRLIEAEARGCVVDVSGTIEQAIANVVDLFATEAGAVRERRVART